MIEKEGQYMSRTVRNGYFSYAGNQQLFRERLLYLKDEEKKDMMEAKLVITGKKIKEQNRSCYFATLVFGVCFIFPLFFLCCQCWKRMVYPAYEVSKEAYLMLIKLVQNTQLQVLTLTVYDNAFNKEKCEILFEMIRKSTLKSFNFYNKAVGFDYQSNEKESFRENMMPIKEMLL